MMYLEGLKKVIEKLESVLPQALELEKRKGFSVNMLQTTVFNTCDSPMCFAGWFGVGLGFQKYTEPADHMAKVCGFSGKQTMEFWANQNPVLWGNENGCGMFASDRAFGLQHPNQSLSQIVDHLKKVYSRVERYQTNSTYRFYVDVLQKIKRWSFRRL